MVEAIGNRVKFTGIEPHSGVTSAIGGGGNSLTSIPTQKPDEFVKQGGDVADNKDNKKLSTNAKIGIGAGILSVAGLVAAAIFMKGKTLKPANFAEHIDFKPAQTMEEAVEFAKKHLGVEKFDFGNDVEMANWVNEGLTNISNRFKGKANMPKELRWENATEMANYKDFIALCDSGKATISFNKNYIDNSVSNFKELVEEVLKPSRKNDKIYVPFHLGADKEVYNEILNLYRRLVKTPSKINRFEAMNGCMLMDDYASSLLYFNKNKLSILKNKIFNNKDAVDILKKNNISVDVKDYEKLSDEQLKDRVTDIIKLIGYNNGITGTATMRGNSKFGVLCHEMGHYMHTMNTSLKDNMWGVLAKKGEEQFLADVQKQAIAGKISSYGQRDPREFVAECFSALCAGKKLPDDVMELYKFYKGPIIPNM